MRHITLLILLVMWKNSTATTTTHTLISPTPASVMTRLISTSSKPSSSSVVFVTDTTTSEESKTDTIGYKTREIKSSAATTLTATSVLSTTVLALGYSTGIKSVLLSTYISSSIDSSVHPTADISPTASISTASKKLTPEFTNILFTNTTPGSNFLEASMISVDQASDYTVANTGLQWTTTEATPNSRAIITPVLATSISHFPSVSVSSSTSPTNTAHKPSIGFITEILSSISSEGDGEATDNITPVHSIEETTDIKTSFTIQMSSSPNSTSSIALKTEFPSTAISVSLTSQTTDNLMTQISTNSYIFSSYHALSFVTPITLITSADQTTRSSAVDTTGTTPLLLSSIVLPTSYSSTLFPKQTLTTPLTSITTTEQTTKSTPSYSTETTSSSLAYTTETSSYSIDYSTETTSSSIDYTAEIISSSKDYSTETISSSIDYSTEITSSSIDYSTEITSSSIDYSTEIKSSSKDYSTEKTSSSIDYSTEITSSSIDYSTETTSSTSTYTTETTSSTPTSSTKTTSSIPTYTTETTSSTPTYTTETTSSTPTYSTETTCSTPTNTTETTSSIPTYTTETTSSTPTYTTETTSSTPTYTTETSFTPINTTETTSSTPTYTTTNTTPTSSTKTASTTEISYPTTTDMMTSPLPETTTQGCIVSRWNGRMLESVPEEKSNLTVTCEFDTNGNCGHIQWRIRNYDTTENTTKITIMPSGYGNSIQSQMIVHRLSQNDAGNISCHLGQRSILFNITIQPLPILSISPLSLVIEEDKQATMVCNISNVNHINRTEWIFRWYHNGSEISVAFHNVAAASSNFSSNKAASGNYQCKLCRKRSPGECQVSRNSRLQVYKSAARFCEGSEVQGVYWDKTPAGYLLENKCPKQTSGIATRKCHADGKWGAVILVDCVGKEIDEASQKLESVKGLSDNEKKKVIGEVLGSIKNVTGNTGSEEDESISSGNLKATTKVLETMVSMLSLSTGTIQVDNTTQENFVGIIDDMLSINNEGSWAEVDEHNENKNSASAAGSLLTTVETFGTAVAKSLDTGESVNLVKDNIVIQIKNTNESSIAFIPNGTTAGSGIDFSLAENDLDNVTFTAALYKTMGTLLQNTRSSSGFTSEVLALSINGQDTSNLSSPVTLTFDTDILMQQNNLMGQTTVDCVFWNDIRGWLSEGCSWVNDTCRCTHLTNFAVIISPVPASDAYVLRIISFVGCILSVLSTVTTIVVYIKLWRYLKSDRSRLLLNLCAALTIAYVLFLVGIDQTEDNTVCTIMAALLHYFFLATFCLMLAEGIQLLISVTFVFHAESKLKWLLLIGWGIPLVIVGVTVGITYDNGYHANDYCWLSLSNGVIYSFVGPAVCIIMVNVIVIFCVMKALFSSKFIATKTEKQKMFAGVRSVTVLLPVLGVTWLFGIISVNNDLIVFQYMFAVTNSLQGFFIFLFYCVFNVSVRRALEKKMKRFEFRTQTSKTGSRIQMMKTKSTDSGKMKDEGRAMKEFHSPNFQFPRPSIDLYRKDSQNILTSGRLSPLSPSHDDDVEIQYTSRSHLYMQQ